MDTKIVTVSIFFISFVHRFWFFLTMVMLYSYFKLLKKLNTYLINNLHKTFLLINPLSVSLIIEAFNILPRLVDILTITQPSSDCVCSKTESNSKYELLTRFQKQCICKDRMHIIIVCNERIEKKSSKIMNFNTNRFP